MEVVATTGATCAKLQSNRQYQRTNVQFFTGRTPFLLPNHQYLSIQGSFFISLLLLAALLTAKPQHRLGRALFLLKTGSLPSYCQIPTDLDKILHTYC